MAIEFDLRGIPYERQKPMTLKFKGKTVGDSQLDFLVGRELVVELKAVEAISPDFSSEGNSLLKDERLAAWLDYQFPCCSAQGRH